IRGSTFGLFRHMFKRALSGGRQRVPWRHGRGPREIRRRGVGAEGELGLSQVLERPSCVLSRSSAGGGEPLRSGRQPSAEIGPDPMRPGKRTAQNPWWTCWLPTTAPAASPEWWRSGEALVGSSSSPLGGGPVDFATGDANIKQGKCSSNIVSLSLSLLLILAL
ncbi:unnamed protein product, partial [Prorocentrum cordatum]